MAERRTRSWVRTVPVLLALVIVASGCLLTPVDHPATSVCPAGAARWSKPATWGGTVPVAGASVIVPAGKTIALDVSPPALKSLQVDGRLVVCRRDTQLTAGWIVVRGLLQAGTADAPFEQHLTMTLTAIPDDDPPGGLGTRGILVVDGQLELHGRQRAVPWTHLAAPVAAGAASLTVEGEVDWEVGDLIAITTTDWFGPSIAEFLPITSIERHEGRTTLGVRVEPFPIRAPRWGSLQHASSTGVSLEPATASSAAPTVLDERAEVANLTRNIVVQSVNDAYWRVGFGVQVTTTGTDSRTQLEGVAIQRGGQLWYAGHHPVSWQGLSYASDGSALPDSTGQHIRGSVVSESANRCIGIQATNGVEVTDNVCAALYGHGIFLQDGVERRNTIAGNLVTGVRNPPDGSIYPRHEVTSAPGSSGMWLTNPDNTVTGNSVSDAEGAGYWLSFGEHPQGASTDVELRPDRTPFGTFADNEAHGNGDLGLLLDLPVVDEAGNVASHRYASTTDGRDPGTSTATLQRFALERISLWKNQVGGASINATWVDLREFVAADNEGPTFAGGGDGGAIERSLLVGTSLNSATDRPHSERTPVPFAPDLTSWARRDNLVVGFP